MIQPTDRPGINHLTSDMLDQLYDRLEQAEAERDALKTVTVLIRAELLHWDGVAIHRIRAYLDGAS